MIGMMGRKAGLISGIAALLVVLAPGGAGAADKGESPKMSPGAKQVPYSPDLFRPDPGSVPYTGKYDADAQYTIYGRKTPKDAPRPAFEIGRQIYLEGPFGQTYNIIGNKNRVAPSLVGFGDWRTAVAFNDNGAKEVGEVATRLNLDIDLKLTATERLHAFVRPLDRGGQFTRCEFAGNDHDHCKQALNMNLITGFFEGDLGAIATGLTGEEASFDLPFAIGLTPFLFQNGIWVDDAFLGGGFSITAKNSAMLGISNTDLTVFGGYTDVTTNGVRNNVGARDNDAAVVGFAGFVDANLGYWEYGFGHVFDRGDFGDQDFNSVTAAFTRRYGSWLSNSVRGFYTFGQNRDAGRQQTADGFAFLVENSFITALPSTLIPYLNAWVGVDKPQPLASDKGLLRNTSINMETDALTGFPKLDDTANNTYGAALGIEYLFGLDQQIVGEVTALRTFGSDVGRPAPGDQYAVGIRWQLPISAAWIIRADAMYGFLKKTDDIAGVRFEVRRKF